MARRFLFLLALLLPLAVAHAAPLDPLFAAPNLWSMKQVEFDIAAKGMGFEWTSAARDSARSVRQGMTVFGEPAVEAVARFDAEKLREITVTIYARGDAGELTKQKYETLIRSSIEAINRGTGVKFTPDRKSVV